MVINKAALSEDSSNTTSSKSLVRFAYLVSLYGYGDSRRQMTMVHDRCCGLDWVSIYQAVLYSSSA